MTPRSLIFSVSFTAPRPWLGSSRQGRSFLFATGLGPWVAHLL